VKAIDPQRVAAYIRWSTEDQAEGTSPLVQREGCRHYILSQGWSWREDLVFVDDACSGATLNRPALSALRRAVQEGRVDCIVVLKLDRLSRSVADTVRLVMEEWDGICHVRSAREPVDTGSQAGRMLFYMLAGYAEWERSAIRDRTMAGKLRRAQEGKNPGFRPPYGYGAGFVPVPGEAVVVRRIFTLYLHGAGMIRIARQLQAEGLRFRGGRPWCEATVKQILSNPIYRGELQYGRRCRNPNRGRRGAGPAYLRTAPAVVRTGAVPALVTRAEFDAVQTARRTRPGVQSRTSGRAQTSSHLLTGLARCSCGSPLIGHAAGGQRYYRCAARRRGAASCSSGYIPQAAVDRVLLASLRHRYGALLGPRLHAVRAEAGSQAAHFAGEQRALRAEEERLAAAGARLRRWLRDGQLTIEEFRCQEADLARERQALRLRAAQLAQTVGAPAPTGLSGAPAPAAACVPAGADLAADRLGPVQWKLLLRHLAESVTLGRQQGAAQIACEICWRWPAEREE
jgi:site-specific DNA recombinase